MSVTETETVEVPRDVVIDALAHLAAAEEILVAMNDNIAPTELSEPLGEAKYGLWIAALGDLPEGNEEYERDAVNVEVEARGCEIAAAALRKAFAEVEPIVIRGGVDAIHDLRDHVYVLERRSERIRELGTIAPWRGDGA